MNIREKLNNNPTAGAIGAVLLLLLCLGLIVTQFLGGGTDSRTPDPAYFFDSASGKVFVETATMDPIKPPSTERGDGKATGYRAHIFACDACGDYEGMTRQQIEKADASLIYLTRSPKNAGPSGGVARVSEPDPVKWVAGSSSAGQRITRVNMDCDNPRAINNCTPGDG